METKLARISQLSKENPDMVFHIFGTSDKSGNAEKLPYSDGWNKGRRN